MSPDRDISTQMSAATKAVGAERALMAAVARAYYLDEVLQVEIAERFGISRFKVARLLDRARKDGIVAIQINDWGLPDPVLSARLRDALQLDHCDVVRSHGDDATVRQQIGAAAAAHLSATLAEGEVLGVNWGRTLAATTSQLANLPRLTIVQLSGFITGDLDSSPIEVARQVARRSGGDIYPIFAPLYAPDVKTAEGLRNHTDIRSALALFPSVTTALLSVGAWDPPDTRVRGALPPDDLANAIAGGCYADIAGILVKEDGGLVDPEFEKRCITLTYDQLRSIPRSLAVAGGVRKAGAIRAVARAGLISELVTDHTLALGILDHVDA
jgi:DNA-binding transcriptional regulator LsrR (DeoR family)